MFNVGDIVMGYGSGGIYSHTGDGSICRVVCVGLLHNKITVQVISAAPQHEPAGGKYDVNPAYFKLHVEKQKEAIPMKIEPLKVYFCKKEVLPEGACGDIAEHRITVKGLSLTLCAIHARPYIKGTETLTPLICQFDEKVCKPGYYKTSGLAFCDEECYYKWQEKMYGRSTARAY